MKPKNYNRTIVVSTDGCEITIHAMNWFAARRFEEVMQRALRVKVSISSLARLNHVLSSMHPVSVTTYFELPNTHICFLFKGDYYA